MLLTAVTDDQGVQHSDADLAAEVLRRKWQKLGEGKVGHEGWRAILRQHVQVAPPDTCWEVSYDVFWENCFVRFALKTTAPGPDGVPYKVYFLLGKDGLGARILYELYLQVMRGVLPPNDMLDVLMVFIPKEIDLKGEEENGVRQRMTFVPS